jgi:hypothetical protein
MLFPAWPDFDLGQRIARKDTEARTVHHRDGSTSTKYQKLDVDFVPGKTNYKEWMQSMVNSKNLADRDFAKEALGATRYNLLKSNKLEIDSLYYKGKLRTIKELKGLM